MLKKLFLVLPGLLLLTGCGIRKVHDLNQRLICKAAMEFILAAEDENTSRLADNLRRLPDWESVVYFIPYRTAADFNDKGVRDGRQIALMVKRSEAVERAQMFVFADAKTLLCLQDLPEIPLPLKSEKVRLLRKDV